MPKIITPATKKKPIGFKQRILEITVQQSMESKMRREKKA